jgi:3-dehydroquinate dehydratase/shikimate dehydrogenase
MKTIRTERLLLRPWTQEDFEPFEKMNADPRVMECFPSVLTKVESDETAKRFKEGIEERGWGLWAVSVLGGAEFIGFIGLNPVGFDAPFTPAVEVGWRLSHEFWNHGYATEGALACLYFAFETLHFDEIVSFTVVRNQRSRRVMEKIGMHHDPKDDFDHPRLLEGDPLRRHVLYRITAEDWREKKRHT